MGSVQTFLTPQLLTILFIFWSLFAIPAALILRKIGRSPAWALLVYFPVLAMLGLWVLAFSLPARNGDTA